jgi:hypothetical protein
MFIADMCEAQVPGSAVSQQFYLEIGSSLKLKRDAGF